MDLNRLREHIVIVNQGSGCVLQPTDQQNSSYILTAKHVVDNSLDDIQITRFQLLNGKEWKEIDIVIDKLELKSNYFPHPNYDIAIIRVDRQAGLDDIVGIENPGDSSEDYILAGYPKARRHEDKSQWYRTDEKTVLKEVRSDGLQGARVPGNPSLEEVKGQSGGAIIKLKDGKGFLAGIQIKMVEGDEQLGAVEFTPFAFFQELVNNYGNDLEPLPTLKYGVRNMRRSVGMSIRKRNYVRINIDDLSEDEALISDLVELIKEDSERVILEEKKQNVLINECNEELLRITNISPIKPSVRVKFRERIGTVLFKILQKHDPASVKKIVEEQESDAMGIHFSFTENLPDDHEENEFSNSVIPWEYLHYPGNIVQNDFPFPMAEKMVIARQLTHPVVEDPNDQLLELKELKVLYVTKEDFKLLDDSTSILDDEIPMSQAVNMLRTKLKNKLEIDDKSLSIDFTHQPVNKPESDVLNSREIGKLITTTNPNSNIIHIVADLHDPNDEIEHKLINAINRAAAQEDKNKLALIIIQQSIRDHRKGQYKNYDKITNDLLRKTRNLSAVMTIPFKLGAGSESFMIASFYENLARGMILSEAYFKLSKEMLNKESIALPILYLKGADFAFIKATATSGGQGPDLPGRGYGEVPLGAGG